VELKQTAESTIYSLETLIKMHLLYQSVIICSCASLVALPLCIALWWAEMVMLGRF
jgi:hypothetical protein